LEILANAVFVANEGGNWQIRPRAKQLARQTSPVENKVWEPRFL